jgi:predicted RNase H-like HicB family nuclease
MGFNWFAPIDDCLSSSFARLLVITGHIIAAMKIKVVVHEAEEGGYWAEVPAILGCATQGETFEELLQNLYEAIEGCLSVDVSPARIADDGRVLEIAV